jgi:hypothetical protein
VLYVAIQRFAERRPLAQEAQPAAVPSTAIEVLR